VPLDSTFKAAEKGRTEKEGKVKEQKRERGRSNEKVGDEEGADQ
jgi:hypothetical protein